MRKIKVKVTETRVKEILVLIGDDKDESEAIEKVEKMYEDGEVKLGEDDITETLFLEV